MVSSLDAACAGATHIAISSNTIYFFSCCDSPEHAMASRVQLWHDETMELYEVMLSDVFQSTVMECSWDVVKYEYTNVEQLVAQARPMILRTLSGSHGESFQVVSQAIKIGIVIDGEELQVDVLVENLESYPRRSRSIPFHLAGDPIGSTSFLHDIWSQNRALFLSNVVRYVTDHKNRLHSVIRGNRCLTTAKAWPPLGTTFRC